MKMLAEFRDFALRRARNPNKGISRQAPAASPVHDAPRLVRRWVRDPKSERLICVWSLDAENENDAGEGDLRLAA